MTMRTLSLFIILTIGFSATAAGINPCEEGMSTPALRFLVTLHAGVSAGQITTEDLQWLMAQPQPVDPIQASRNPDTLFFKQKFRAEIPRITPAQWKLIVAQVRPLAKTKMEQQTQIQEAQTRTESVAAIVKEFEFPILEEVTGHFVSSKGELFVSTQTSDSNFIYSLTAKTRHQIQRSSSNRNPSDFFESQSGKILFTLNAKDQVTIHDARTGHQEFIHSPQPYRLATLHTPVLYEEQGVLTILLTTRSEARRDGDEFQLKINVETGQEFGEEDVMQGNYRFLRLADQHVYRFGTSHAMPNGGMTIELRDLTTGKNLIRKSKKSQDYVGFEAILIDDHGPSLSFRYVETKQHYALAPKTRKFVELKNPENLPDFDQWVTHLGQTFSAKAPIVDGKRIVIFQNILTGESRIFDLDFEEGSWVQRQQSFSTPSGVVLAIWELTQDQREKLHLISVAKNDQVVLPYPSPANRVQGIFHTPSDGRILMLAKNGVGGRWTLYQVWGPERRAE